MKRSRRNRNQSRKSQLVRSPRFELLESRSLLSATALADDGHYITTWDGRGSTDLAGVFAQQFSATGQSLTSPVLVNTTILGEQSNPAIALAPNGVYTIAWQGRGVGDEHGIFFRQFTASGDPIGSEIRANTNTLLVQLNPTVAMSDDGRFVIVWESHNQDGSGAGVFGQRFAPTGIALGSEFRVNTTTSGDQYDPHVSMASDGRFTAVWTSSSQDGSGTAVIAQRYQNDGTRQGGEVIVNTTMASNQFEPQVAVAGDASSVIVWTSAAEDGTGFNVRAQEFDASGNRTGGELLLNSTLPGHQRSATVSIDDQGDFVAVWNGFGAGDRDGVYSRAMVNSVLGPETAVNQTQLGPQGVSAGALASSSNGASIVTYNSFSLANLFSYGEPTPILARQFNSAGQVTGGETLIVGEIPITTPPTPPPTSNPPAVVTPISDVAVAQDAANTVINVASNFSGEGLTFSVLSNTNTALLSATIAGSTLTLDYAAGQNGNATITVRATDTQGRTIDDNFQVTVNAPGGPSLVTPIADVSVVEDAANSTINLAGSFNGQGLLFSVLSNSNANLVTASISGSTLTLDYQTNRNGVATIAIRATDSSNQTVDDTFTVTVTQDGPTVVVPVDNVTALVSTANQVINLGGAFADPDNVGTIVRMDTSLGVINVELFGDNDADQTNEDTPATVRNFLNYVNSGAYTDSIFHRSAQNFVIQGGGFEFPGFTSIPTNPPVVNEFGASNRRGTIAMAKLGGDPNSATNQWFFNLGNNAANLDNQNGGFTVFGRVIGNSINVVDAIAAVPRFDLDNFLGPAFGEIPLRNYTSTNPPTTPTAANVIQIFSITPVNNVTGALGQDTTLTLSVTNSNPGIVAATVNPPTKMLTLDFVNNASGTATITVRATDPGGSFVEDTFTVTTSPSPLLAAGAENPTTIQSAEELAGFNPRALSAEMQLVLDDAIARFANVGLSTELVSKLQQANVQLADLPGAYLGVALGSDVWIDADAAGMGWFVDSTPGDDLEFLVDANRGLQANDDSAAAGKFDLLSAMAHELGHVLGWPDLDSNAHGNELMSDTLEPGTRRRLAVEAVDQVLAEAW